MLATLCHSPSQNLSLTSHLPRTVSSPHRTQSVLSLVLELPSSPLLARLFQPHQSCCSPRASAAFLSQTFTLGFMHIMFFPRRVHGSHSHFVQMPAESLKHLKTAAPLPPYPLTPTLLPLKAHIAAYLYLYVSLIFSLYLEMTVEALAVVGNNMEIPCPLPQEPSSGDILGGSNTLLQPGNRH